MSAVRTSWPKIAVFSLLPLLLVLMLAEAGSRLTAFVVYDFSPYFLYYGFSDAYQDYEEEGHTATFDGYFKFPESRVLRQYGLFEEAVPIRINNHGFRGTDFESEKPPGGFRVVCMGGSSTFGFFGRDDYTYPALLTRALQDVDSGVSVEVINAGVPHMNSSHIVAMLEGEVISYAPDVVTLYSAYNDATRVMDENWAQVASRWSHEHFAAYVALKRALEAIGGPVLHSRWSGYLPRADREHIEHQISLHKPIFEANLRRFVDQVESAGAIPILIRQPMTTQRWNKPVHGVPPAGTDYDGEVAWIRANLERHGYVGPSEATMLVHAALIDVLDRVARERDVGIVDFAKILGGDASFFASYVHLTEDANQRLATALAERVGPLRHRPAAEGPAP